MSCDSSSSRVPASSKILLIPLHSPFLDRDSHLSCSRLLLANSIHLYILQHILNNLLVHVRIQLISLHPRLRQTLRSHPLHRQHDLCRLSKESSWRGGDGSGVGSRLSTLARPAYRFCVFFSVWIQQKVQTSNSTSWNPTVQDLQQPVPAELRRVVSTVART